MARSFHSVSPSLDQTALLYAVYIKYPAWFAEDFSGERGGS